MILLAWFDPDAASINLRDRMLEEGAWADEGAGIVSRGNFLMKGYETEHLHTNGIGLEKDLSKFDIEGIIILSRHRSETGRPTLTVHNTGNFSKADFGGKGGILSMSYPAMAGGILRALRKNGSALEYAVSLEVTHHGPLSELPLIFVEIGSSDAEWRKPEPAKALVQSIMAPDVRDLPIAIGIGGGHYAPRFSDLCASGSCDFGHIAPNHHLDFVDERMVAHMRDRTPGCSHFALHLKDSDMASKFKRLCTGAGLLPLA